VPSEYIPVVIFLVLATLFPIVTLLAAKLVRPQSPFAAKLRPYECGIEPESDSRGRYTVRFYIVAILFVIFDVETIFLFPWAVQLRVLGLFGLIEMGIFLAILIVAYAFGYSLLAFDLIMSLAHKWVSNLYGAFYFMGSFLAGLMALAIFGVTLRRAMGLRDVFSARQQHDLAKLCFGFTVFWAYLMWSQFLVIWYGNLPEETYFLFYRLIGPWRPVGLWVFLLVFVIPFVGLLGAKLKRYPPTLFGFALISLVGIWLERYLEVVPSINGGAGPAIGVPEIGVTLFFSGLFAVAIGWFAGRYPMISPRLAADTLEREQH